MLNISMRVLPLFFRTMIAYLFPTLFPCFSALLLPHPSLPPSSSSSPSPVHTVLNDPPKNIYCIGDIHGCHSEFLSLLSKIRSLEGGDPCYLRSVILVGDLVNKGPSSLSTLRYCREHRILSVRGNHDVAALSVYRGTKSVRPDQSSKYGWVSSMSEDDASYLQSLPCTVSFEAGGRNHVVVHAGLVPGVPLFLQSESDMTTLRLVRRVGSGEGGSYKATRGGEGEEGGGELPWAKVYDGEHGRVVFGHDAKRGLQVNDNAVGLDTGCVYGREITAVKIGRDDGKIEFISSPCEEPGGYAPVSRGS
ncbi:hypothetical protein TrCOL_g8043 [Triparma columacea]|uniref:Calcineurin-like phosphoesterase domain-containing protein n=1 Tax=Triparma columacea TaxID=722753 RepID=A0A9W7GRQ7_9STRA|nr:hypothetical protein TrCOL_g8043 [Triparma columacea]